MLVTRSGHAREPHDRFEHVFTANPRAARAHGALHRSIATEATMLLARAGSAACPPLKARRLLTSASRELGSHDPAGSSARYMPALREVIRTGTDPRALAAAGPRGAHLAALLERYRARLRDEALFDPAELFWLAVEAGPVPASIGVFGYTHLGSGEAAFIAALAGPGSELHLPVRDVLGTGGATAYSATFELAASFRALGWTVTDRSEADPQAAPAMTAAAHQNEADEVRAVLARAKDMVVSGVRPDEIVLLTRDEAGYGPTVQAVAWEYGLRVSSYNTIQLAHTRIGELTRLVLDVVTGGLPFEATTRLAGHAFGPALPRAAWRSARRSGAAGAAAWREHGLDTGLLTWPERASPGRFAGLLTGCFDAWDVSARATRSAHEAYALQALTNGVQELATLQPPDEETGLTAWRDDILELMALTGVPAAPGRGGLELHTPLSVTGASYRHVFVLGALEGRLPPRPGNDPALPWYLRQQVEGLEGITQLVNREAALIRSAVASATESVHFTLPLDAGRGAAVPSPLLGELGISLAAAGSPLLASAEEERRHAVLEAGPTDDPVLEAARRALQIELRREGQSDHDEFDGVTGIGPDMSERSMSVTQLSTLGRCPFRWFAAYMLGLSPDEDALSVADPLTVGSLYHETLDLALTRLKERGDPDLRANLATEIPSAFGVVEASLGRDGLDLRSLPGWSIIRREHLDALVRAASSEEFFAGDPIGSEVRFDTQWRGLRMRGMIDRVDQSAEGLVLVDVKLGTFISKVQDEDGKLSHDLQLPVYTEIGATLFPDRNIAGSRYFSIRKSEVIKQDAPPEGFLDGFVQDSLRMLAGGHFPVRPDVRQDACEYCEFKSVCRHGGRLEHKRQEEAPA